MPTPSPEPSRHSLPVELRALLWLAVPIMGSQVAQTAMGFVDTVMAGRVSPADLAAVAVGSSIWIPIFLFTTGVVLALSPFVAQLHGARAEGRIPAVVHQTAWLALGLGVTGFLIVRNLAPVLDVMEVAPEIRGLTLGYLDAVSWGMPAVALFQVLRSYSEGLNLTRPVMVISFLGLLINIPANYVLIYGKLGFPAMGSVGCGWATSLVMWVMLVSMVAYTALARAYRSSYLYRRAPPSEVRAPELLRVGLPIGTAFFIEVTLFTVIALMIASLGAEIVAAHQIALNFAGLVFMIPLSLALAITVRVGNALGRGAPADARYAAWVGVGATLVWAAFTFTFILVFSDVVVRLYTPDPFVQQLAVSLLFWAALFQFSDGVQVSAAGALRGYKDTRVTLIVTLVSFWGVGLTSGYLLGLSEVWGPPMGPKGFWIGLVFGLSLAALLLGWRLRHVSRRAEVGSFRPER